MLCLDPVQSNSVLSVFSLSGHPATNIDDALLEPSGCRGDVFTAAMQVQLRVIGKRVKNVTQCRLTMSARSATYNMNSTGPRTEPCGTKHTMYTTDEVPPAYTTRYVLQEDMNEIISKLFHAGQIDAQVAATAARDRQCRRQLLNQAGRVLTPAPCLRRAAGHCRLW